MRSSLVTIVAAVTVLCACGASEGQLKARAASDFNCAEDRLQIREIDDSTKAVSGCGRSATYVETCTGAPRAMAGPKCTWRRDSSEQAAQPSSKAKAESAERTEVQSAPTGLGGFKFGMAKQDAEQSCNDGEQQFSASEEDKATCSAPIEAVGLEGQLQMRFCEGKACMFRVRDGSTDGGTKGALKRLVAIRKALVARYGRAESGDMVVQSDCVGETTSVQCIKNGRAKAEYEWRFEAGHRIRLRTRVVEEAPVIELRYDAPKRKEPGELSL